MSSQPTGRSELKTIHSERYRYLLAILREARESVGMTQVQLSQKLGKPQSYVSKYENGERRLDVIELLDVCEAVGANPQGMIKKVARP